MKTDTVELPKPDTHCIDEDTGKDVWSHSPEQMREYAAQVAAAENYGLLSLLYDIRVAAGDKGGKLMQDELVARIARLRADAERYRWIKRGPRADVTIKSAWGGVDSFYAPTCDLDAAIDAAMAAK